MKIVEYQKLRTYIEDHMHLDWSPEEIAGRIKYVDTQLPSITSPSIYKFVYSVHGRNLEKHLRYGKHTGRTAYERKVTIDGRTFIDKRPKRVATRRFFGDWESAYARKMCRPYSVCLRKCWGYAIS